LWVSSMSAEHLDGRPCSQVLLSRSLRRTRREEPFGPPASLAHMGPKLRQGGKASVAGAVCALLVLGALTCGASLAAPAPTAQIEGAANLLATTGGVAWSFANNFEHGPQVPGAPTQVPTGGRS
jgi:hypothetical protein